MKIKYDKKSVKLLWGIVLFSVVIFVLGWILVDSNMKQGTLVGILGIYSGSILFPYAVFNLIAAFCYACRLRRNGYELPYDRKAYKNDLLMAPRKETEVKKKGENIESRILFGTYSMVFIGITGWNLYYGSYWSDYIGKEAIHIMWVLMGISLFWLIEAVIYFRQANELKYCDDVEADFRRKQRETVEYGMLKCMVILCIVLFINKSCVSGAKYVFHSRGEHDMEYLSAIQKSVYMAMEEEIKGKRYEQLLEGCYITEWTIPDDDFSETVAYHLGIENFANLQELIYCADGKPDIYVKITDEKVYVRMDNPLRLPTGIQYTYEVE